jgi:hypothetical protein
VLYHTRHPASKLSRKLLALLGGQEKTNQQAAKQTYNQEQYLFHNVSFASQ